MQNCYIRVINDKVFEHPFVEENLKQVIPDFDPENLPEGLERFVRVPMPDVGFLETYEGSTYQKIDGVWKDVYNIRPLTEEEKAAKISFAKMTFLFANTWTLNEQTGVWVPPVPYPEDGKNYKWNDENQKWILFE